MRMKLLLTVALLFVAHIMGCQNESPTGIDLKKHFYGEEVTFEKWKTFECVPFQG